ncbi:MAG: hypothetical protein R2705_07165 [Ilumatobacteraceae bacterium]
MYARLVGGRLRAQLRYPKSLAMDSFGTPLSGVLDLILVLVLFGTSRRSAAGRATRSWLLHGVSQTARPHRRSGRPSSTHRRRLSGAVSSTACCSSHVRRSCSRSEATSACDADSCCRRMWY